MAKLTHPYSLYPHRQEPHNKGTDYMYWAPFTDKSQMAKTEDEAKELARKMLNDTPELFAIVVKVSFYKTKDQTHAFTMYQSSSQGNSDIRDDK